jgi:hypothetical protein
MPLSVPEWGEQETGKDIRAYHLINQLVHQLASPDGRVVAESDILSPGGYDFMTMFMNQVTIKPIATGRRRDLEDLGRALQHDIRLAIGES